VQADGVSYCSQATRVTAGVHTFTIERERTASNGRAPERDVVELDRLSAAQLEREGAAVGLRAEPTRHIPATADHTGATVVVLRG
jgi:hypothetical protein